MKVRIVHNKLLGGWFIVRGAHDTPIGGRFETKGQAQAWLNRKIELDAKCKARLMQRHGFPESAITDLIDGVTEVPLEDPAAMHNTLKTILGD